MPGCLERVFVRSGRSIAVIATNATIESTTKQRHPDRRISVRSFTVADPSMYIGEDERRPAAAGSAQPTPSSWWRWSADGGRIGTWKR